MGMKEIARGITEAAKAADTVLVDFLAADGADEERLADSLKEYAGIKLQLKPEEIGDNITIMVRISISNATGIPLEKLKEMDKAGACGSAPAVLSKRVLLFLDVQKKLGITLPPDKLYGVQTVQDLAELAFPLISENTGKQA